MLQRMSSRTFTYADDELIRGKAQHWLALLSSTLRGGTAQAHRAELLQIATVNVSSLMKNCLPILACQHDFIGITETRCTSDEQKLLQRRFMASHMRCKWSAAVDARQGEGMKGRSGGVLLTHSQEWIALGSVKNVPLAASSHCWVMEQFTSHDRRDSLVVCAYYGHPSEKNRTMQDLAVLFSFTAEAEVPVIILGDFNLTTAQVETVRQEFEITEPYKLTDAEDIWTYRNQQRCTQPDRIFVPSIYDNKIMHSGVDIDIVVPQHKMLYATYTRTPMTFLTEVAIAPINLAEKHDTEWCQLQEDQAVRHMETALEQCRDVTINYEEWSSTWENYLLQVYKMNDLKQKGRGKLPSKQQHTISVSRPRTPRLMARLSNYINELERVIIKLQHGQEVPQALWQRIIRNSTGLTRQYGAPRLDQLSLTSDEAVIQVLKVSKEHFEGVLAEEWRHRQHHYSLEFRQRLHEYGGANKYVTKLLAGGAKKGRLFHEGKEVIGLQEQLQLASGAWKHFISQPPMTDDGEWKAAFPTTPLRGCQELPNIGWREVKHKLAHMKAKSSPGPDGWRVKELKSLPDRALMQLCRIMNRMEMQQQVPSILAATWSALLPVTKPHATALDMRPIALASVVWRCYAGVRCRALQDWMDNCMSDQLYAYRRGRSAGQAALKLGLAVDKANLEGQQLHVISLDASKAFPAASRWQLMHVMRKRGCSERVLSTLENFYSHCVTVYRVMGKYISKGAAAPQRGILQGCPLSVLCFSSLQEPLIQFMQRHFPQIEMVIYADDVSYWSTDKELLLLATPHILRFYALAGVTLNAKKTQYWTLQQNKETFDFDQTTLQATTAITILGHTFDSKGADQPEAMARLTDKIMNKLQRLKELPMSEDAKEHSAGAIIGAAAWYCPWIAICQGITLHGPRMALLSAIRPRLSTGPRAQAAAIALCIKFHAVDPFLSPCYKLAKLMVLHWNILRPWLQQAVVEETKPVGPVTVFARMLMLLKVKIIVHGLQLANSEVLVMSDQQDTPKWRHSLRAFLRSAELLRGTMHRREFQELQSLPIDWNGSLHWHRALKAGTTRSALEWVITGGILTPARISRKKEGAPVILSNL